MHNILLQEHRDAVNDKLDMLFNDKKAFYCDDSKAWYIRDVDLINNILLSKSVTKDRFEFSHDLFDGKYVDEISIFNDSIASSMIFRDISQGKPYWSEILSNIESKIDNRVVNKFIPLENRTILVQGSAQGLNNEIFDFIERELLIESKGLRCDLINYARFLDGFLETLDEIKELILSYKIALNKIYKAIKEVPGFYNSKLEFVSDIILVLTASLNSTSDLICECLVNYYKNGYKKGILETVLKKKPPITVIGRVSLNSIKVGDIEIPKNKKIYLLTGYAVNTDLHSSNILAYGIGNGRCSGYKIANHCAKLFFPKFIEKYPYEDYFLSSIDYEIGFAARSIRNLEIKGKTVEYK